MFFPVQAKWKYFYKLPGTWTDESIRMQSHLPMSQPLWLSHTVGTGLNIKIHTPCRTAKSVGLGGATPPGSEFWVPSSGCWVLGSWVLFLLLLWQQSQRFSLGKQQWHSIFAVKRDWAKSRVPIPKPVLVQQLHNLCGIYLQHRRFWPGRVNWPGPELCQSGKPFARLHNVSDNAMKRAVKLTQKRKYS